LLSYTAMRSNKSARKLLTHYRIVAVPQARFQSKGREFDPKKLIPPLHGALIKNEQDVHLFERLAFMARREGR